MKFKGRSRAEPRRGLGRYASAGGLLDDPEYRDEVGADRIEQDVKTRQNERADRGRSGCAMVNAKGEPLEGADQCEQVPGQVIPLK